MVEILKKSFIKTLNDICTIKTTELIFDNFGVIIGEKDNIIYENIPCGISHYNITNSNIIVKHYNEEHVYTLSGTPIVYDTHLEVFVIEKV